MFRTIYTERIEFPAPTGTGKEPEYSWETDINGKEKLVQTGERDVYAEIQENLEQTKIENILKRFMDPVNGEKPTWGDIDTTDMPTNLAEAQQQLINAENIFNGLDTETRRKFDNSVKQFIASFGKTEWIEKMGINQKSPAQIEKERTAENIEKASEHEA